MKKRLIVNTILISLLSIATSSSFALEKNIIKDPHRAEAGFFDIHICNWPDRPPFYLTLFGTEQYENITSIEVLSPEDKKIGELNLKKFTVSKKKNKPERHVFLTQLAIPRNKKDGWYSARINFRNKPSQTAFDFVIHQTLSRASSHSPENNSEDIKKPNNLSWDAIPGANFYQVFIKDIWSGGKVIHTSKLINTHSYDLPQDLLQPGGYYAWRVHARDLNEHVLLGDFNLGSLSKWVEFSVGE